MVISFTIKKATISAPNRLRITSALIYGTLSILYSKQPGAKGASFHFTFWGKRGLPTVHVGDTFYLSCLFMTTLKGTMMKQHPLRFLLIPALLCALFGAAFLGTAGTTHAASVQPHMVTPLIGRVTCNFSGTQPSIATDYGQDIDCFWGAGGENVALYNVTSLYSGAATLSFSWIGCDGSTHSSKISSYRKPDLKAPVIHAGDEKSFLVWGLGRAGT